MRGAEEYDLVEDMVQGEIEAWTMMRGVGHLGASTLSPSHVRTTHQHLKHAYVTTLEPSQAPPSPRMILWGALHNRVYPQQHPKPSIKAPGSPTDTP